jgi:hypothetical protein
LKPGAYPRGYPKDAPLRYTKALITNIRLGWNGLLGRKALAHLALLLAMKKSFKALTINVNLTSLSFTTQGQIS